MATIVFFPEGAFGPTNNCVGIGSVLRERGHRVVFVVEESFAGALEAKGFEEALMRLAPPPQEPEVPGQFWKDFIRDTGPEFRRPTIEQLESFLRPTWQALIDGSIYVNDRLGDILDELHPDAIVEDNVVAFGAIAASGRPWARIASCNPAEIKDPAVPPVFGGLPVGDRRAWADFWAEYDRVLGPQVAEFDAWLRAHGAPGLPGSRDYMWESPYLNLYLFPGAADYEREVPLAPTWHRLDSSVRTTEGPFDVDLHLPGEGKLIYLSLGSLASADVELMQRLIDVLAKTDHRVIVSKGPQHELLNLADNMYGEEFLPQPSILPQVDLVITHGGNNTVTECFHFGKPMVVLPVFWDQYDNAQRVHELGFGVRLPTYSFEQSELTGAIELLLADESLRARLSAVSAELQAAPGNVRATDLVERLAVEKAPVT
ncbi:MAG: glycosyl transferase [Actinobacteria bacterium]|nr:glycosyl transferase [Actinomycetota bacterium]